MKIVGIDPGSIATGFGVVAWVRGEVAHVAHGVLRPPRSGDPADRLAFLYRAIREVVEEYQPDRCAIERVFVSVSPRSALVLGQARGVALAALATGRSPIAELAAREVKQAVTGSGRASKAQVQSMVARLLQLDREPPSDAADALAVAIGCAHAGPLADAGVRNRKGGRRFRESDLVGRSFS